MPVTFNNFRSQLPNFHPVELNESRIQRLMSGDREKALYMGLWDRFRDLFREDKKAEVLKAFRDLMSPEQDDGTSAAAGSCEELKGAIYAFQELRDRANTGQRKKFVIKLTPDRSGSYCVKADFLINGESVRTTSYYPPAGWADLIDVNLNHADLAGADLCNAKLTGAHLVNADLRGAILTGADLAGASLYGTWLYGAKVGDVTLTRDNFSTYFPYARGVESIHWEADP